MNCSGNHPMRQSFYRQVFYRLTGLGLEKSLGYKTRKYDIVKVYCPHFSGCCWCVYLGPWEVNGGISEIGLSSSMPEADIVKLHNKSFSCGFNRGFLSVHKMCLILRLYLCSNVCGIVCCNCIAVVGSTLSKYDHLYICFIRQP